jgi:hypothetical protein
VKIVFSDDDDLLAQWWEEEDEHESELESNHDDNDDLIAIHMLADMDQEKHKRKRRGSIPGHLVVPRNISSGNLRMVADYFADSPVYNANFFQRRFGCRETFSCTLWMAWRHMMITSGRDQMQ